MKNDIHVTPKILESLNEINQYGHTATLRNGDGGNNHGVTKIIINVRHPNEKAFVNKLVVRFTSSYQKYEEFIGCSDEDNVFGDLNFYPQESIKPFLEKITPSLIEQWRVQSSTNATKWYEKLAQV